MSNELLTRDDAPFGEKVWAAIDGAVLNAARSQLAARRILHVDGPFGLGLTAIPRGEAPAVGGMSVNPPLPLAMIRKAFTLPTRDIATIEQTGAPVSLSAAVAAAIEVARMEDALIFRGADKVGIQGLLTAKGAHRAALRDWSEVGTAAEDIIEAVTVLDGAGFAGPYVLALAPPLYNRLLRRYPQGNASELEHIRTIVTEGIVKAPSIDGGGVLLASGRPFASIVLGQDLMTGLLGPGEEGFEFLISESLTLRLTEPSAVVVLKPAG
ncbi:MAG: bacteriocin family protein [Planctomycetes bacterium]|nr:bacteriocin family protein [Planctomycetota bacterium]